MTFVNDQSLCTLLAGLCRNPDRRVLGQWEQGHPRRWTPYAVKAPGTNEYFSAEGAWEFVAEMIDAKYALRLVALHEPPGAVAYELLIPAGKGVPDIYIKLTLSKSGKTVIGRSFHYSER